MKIEMDSDLQDLLEGRMNKRYRQISRNATLLNGFIRAYQILESVENVADIGQFSFLHYEHLKYEYSGLSSVRLDNRYVHRLLFEEKDDSITLKLIEIDDTHYGNKK